MRRAARGARRTAPIHPPQQQATSNTQQANSKQQTTAAPRCESALEQRTAHWASPLRQSASGPRKEEKLRAAGLPCLGASCTAGLRTAALGAVNRSANYSPLLLSSTELPGASSQAPRAPNGGAGAIGGGGLLRKKTSGKGEPGWRLTALVAERGQVSGLHGLSKL
jgi:hypothetical protein